VRFGLAKYGWSDVKRPSAAGEDPIPDLEYIKAMIDFARDDARQVYLRVTGAVAIAVLFLTQLPFERLAALDTPYTCLLFGGLGAMLLSAVFHFTYLSQVHLSRRHLMACLPTRDVGGAYDALAKTERRWIRSFHMGDLLIVIGIILLAVVLGELLAVSPTPHGKA
jgi:lipoprotein signal peptidase